MNDLWKVKLSDILASCQFWMVTFVFYLQAQGLSLAQAFQLLSIFSLCIVLLEYPTGVISDYYSPKISLIVGYFCGACAFLLVSLHGSYYYYIIPMVLGALGAALQSGSDTALLHSVSKDFKHDFAQVKYYSIIMSVIAITTGGLVAPINLRLPTILTAIFFFTSALLLIFTSRIKQDKVDGNIFATAKEGISHVLHNRQLFHLTVVGVLWSSFFVSIKWFFNPLFLQLHIPLTVWGFITSIAFLLTAAGTWYYRKNHTLPMKSVIVGMLVAILLMGTTITPAIPLIGIFVLYLCNGYFDTQINVASNAAIESKARASILSLGSLLARLGSAAYISGMGYILSKSSFFFVVLTTVIGFIVLGGYSLLQIKSVKD